MLNTHLINFSSVIYLSICTQNEASDFPQSILLYTENLMPQKITYLTWVSNTPQMHKIIFGKCTYEINGFYVLFPMSLITRDLIG